jgi:dienelactone hydrolase
MRRTVLAATAVVLALVAAGCLPEAPPAPPPVAATETVRGLPVSEHQYVFTDTSRGIPALDAFPGSPDRPIPVTVWYPSDRSHGPYPLVVFAHGFGVDPSFYAELLSRIASAGYVVAAPTYPILSGWPAGPSDQVGWNDLFDDTHFATSAVLFASAVGDPFIGGLVDGDRIAVAGHSDGALVAFGDGFEAWRNDPRVRAVISYAALLREPGTTYQPNGRAFLHFASDQDEYNDFGTTLEWDHENLGQPSWTVALWNAQHAPPYTDPADPHFDLVVRTTVDFLDAELKGGSSVWFALDVMFAPGLAAFM